MKKFLFLGLVVFSALLLTADFAHAQDPGSFKLQSFDYKVAVKNRGSIMLESAYMEKTVADQSTDKQASFKLTFLVPRQLEEQLANTSLKLTAYDQKGNVFGMRVWNKVSCFTAADAKEATNTKAPAIPVALEVSPHFANAARFSLEAGPLEMNISNGQNAASSASCPQCVALANETCGAGKVASVKCGVTKDGSSCEFTCKP